MDEINNEEVPYTGESESTGMGVAQSSNYYVSSDMGATPSMSVETTSYYGQDTSSDVTPEVAYPDKMREIHIQELHIGYMVRVGCHSFALETKASLIDKLTKYINDPQGTEEKWFKEKTV